MLAFDSAKAAAKAMKHLPASDPRVHHFWDPKNRLGEQLSKSLGWEADDTAWDFYAFYGPTVEWGETFPPPDPLRFFHQLSYHSDHPQYQTGDNLIRGLGGLVKAVGAVSEEEPQRKAE